MLTIRKADARGRASYGWLDSRHSFSFGQYYDPRYMGYGPLRVINDDHIAAGGGFSPHPHTDMEIVTYVVAGALQHRDSLGNGSVIRPGDVQRMSAGTGIHHSEFNASTTEPVHLLQIWIEPDAKGLAPSYEQKTFPARDRRGRLCLIAARGGRCGAVAIHRDADLYAALVGEADRLVHAPAAGRLVWVQVASGSVILNGHALATGDGASLRDEAVTLEGRPGGAEILVFDMAP